MMKPLRFAVIGAGFWARYQLAGWREAGAADCIAICNRTRSRAESLAREFGIPAVYTDPGELLRRENPDVVDIISAPGAHEEHVLLVAAGGFPVICQKPMALSLAAAERMVTACREKRVPFFVHENWRWQAPIRALKRVLDGGRIGTVFRGRINMISGYPVFRNQPFFKTLDRFLLTDQGSHQLDVARFLFGEAESVYCHTDRVHPDIRGEDVATVMLRMRAGATVVVSMGFAENFLERDHHPQTYIFVEGDKGSAELGPDYWVRVTTETGTHAGRHPPPRYQWVDPEYEVAQASIVPCIADIMRGLRKESTAETTGEDNLKTVRLVAAAYDSAETGQAVRVT
jgi:predicted dehydrogenase